MNYRKIYDSIITNAQRTLRCKADGYYERHHIVPRSLGGDNSKQNLVLLTAKEHFICHLLLVKMFTNDQAAYSKMLHAFMLMKGENQHQLRYYSVSYQRIKIEYSILMSRKRKGVALTADHKLKISQSCIGRKFTEETKAIISMKAKTRKRKPWSDEYRQKMSEIMKIKHRHS